MITLKTFPTFLIFSICITQIFSSVLFVPGTENIGGSIFRVLLSFFAIFFIMNPNRIVRFFGVDQGVVFAIFLAIWMVLSLSWSSNMIIGIKHVVYIGTIIFLMVVLRNIVDSEHRFFEFSKFITIVGFLVLIFSAAEIITGIHLFRSSIQDLSVSNIESRYIVDGIAWFTFDNPNDLSVHLAITCFFAAVLVGQKKLYDIILCSYITGVIYMCILLDARVVVFAICTFLLVFLFARIQKRSGALILVSIVGVVTEAGLLTIAVIFSQSAEFLDVSSFIRLQLMSLAAEMAADTLLLGIGSGGFEDEVIFGGFTGQTYGIVNPHSAWARMLAENGIVGLGLFLFIIVGPVIALRKAKRVSTIGAFVASGTVAMPLLLSAGSDPLASSSLQLAIAIMWIATSFAVEGSTDAVKSHRLSIVSPKISKA